jgi:AraC-like DNA-binding protein
MFSFQFNTNGITETISNTESHNIKSEEAIIHESGDYGSATFIKTSGGNANIWFRELDIVTPTILHCQSRKPYLYLHINISNTMLYSTSEGMNLLFKEDQCNLLFGSQMESSISLQKGNYRIMEVHFLFSYLEKWADHIPFLQNFLHSVKKDVTGSMFNTNLDASHEMVTIIKHIIFCIFKDDLKTMYIEGKALELLTICLNKGMKVNINPILLKQIDKEKLSIAKQYLLNNLDQNCSTEELARIVGISEWVLKRGFRQLFSVTIHEFLLIKRMEKAKELLLTTDKPVKDIAYLTGYSNKSNFTNAFKKRFGFSPGYFKKNA